MLLTNVGLVSHLVAALGFASLAGTALWWRRNRASFGLAAAALLTALWAIVFVAAERGDPLALLWLSPTETMRTTAWVAFLVALLRPSWALDERTRLSFTIAGMLGFVVTLQMVLDLQGATFGMMVGSQSLAIKLFVISRLAVCVAGLVAVHNLYVYSGASENNAGRMLALGVGAILVYDLNLYTLTFLLGQPSRDLYNIRGAANVVALPFMLTIARNSWFARVQLSRQVVFHTLSFSMIGVYLIAMALLAYGLRLAGGNWGLLFQVTFLFATIAIGVVVIVSKRFRAVMRVQIAKNFFTYKYDYRQEWPRFIATVSQTGAILGSLHERVIQAICTVVDSPGGILFIPDDNNLVPVADWHLKVAQVAVIGRTSGLACYLADRQRIVDFDGLRAEQPEYDGVGVPDWVVANRRMWLAIPLIHLDSLAGVLVVERSLVDRSLNWEDFDLLRTLGRQAASYIAESSTQVALDEAAKFDEFNRRFAFIIHDIKNLVSQLSLVARNADRHADNPAFRADMVTTLNNSVGKMNDLLARLSPRVAGCQESFAQRLAIADLVEQAVATKRLVHPNLSLALLPNAQSVASLCVVGDTGRIEQLLLHLVQNAIDASNPGTPINISVSQTPEEAIITIADRGVGMSARFIREELFRPFHSTKAGGFGIGAYEAREIARAHGGRLDVESQEGEGTMFSIRLPLARADAPFNVAAQ